MLDPAALRLIDDAALAIDALTVPHPIRVGVDGFCASGKTTVSDRLAEALAARGRRVIRASTDSFQNPPAVRWQRGEDSPEGFYRDAVDFVALRRELLDPLGPGGERRYRLASYDLPRRQPILGDRALADEGSVLILDGLFLHTAEIAPALEYSLLIEASAETCIRRARRRNQERRATADEVERLYRRRYLPGWALYLEEVEARRFASLVVPNEGA